MYGTVLILPFAFYYVHWGRSHTDDIQDGFILLIHSTSNDWKYGWENNVIKDYLRTRDSSTLYGFFIMKLQVRRQWF